MCLNRFFRFLMVGGFVYWGTGCRRNPAPVLQPPPSVQERADQPQIVSPTVQDLLKTVDDCLGAVINSLHTFVLSPIFKIINQDQVNAYATAKIEETGEQRKLLPIIRIYGGMLNRVINIPEDPDGAACCLAIISGHELAHVVQGHLVRPPKSETSFVQIAFTRQQEHEAGLQRERGDSPV